MPYRVGDSGNAAHVRADLQVLQRGGEYIVGICHFFTTYQALAGQVRGGRYVFVYHGISAAAAIVLIAHLLANNMAQPVCCPGFAFRDIEPHRSLFDEESASVALGAGFDTVVACPLLIYLEESFFQEFCLCEFEIVAGPVDLILELFTLCATVIEVLHLAQTA